MPRRPRPASRAPPASAKVSKAQTNPNPRAEKLHDLSLEQEAGPSSRASSISASGFSEGVESDQDDDLDDNSFSDSDISAPDVDAPRVAYWVDEDELDVSESEEEKKTVVNTPEDTLKSLQKDLSSLPLGTLKKAQKTLVQATVSSDSDSEHSDTDSDKPSPKGKEKAKPEWSTRPRPDLAKRSNKHAPQEVTSKRPVSRKRTVVEVKTYHPRDPRFLPLARELTENAFNSRYSFLAESHVKELQTLRENLKRARKLLVTSQQHLRHEREEEVNRLELAVKRAESLVNRDRREKIEREAMQKVNSEEKDKRKQGKGEWWMKKSDKRELLVRARYEALASSGGKGAVRKFIEKKQKKISQKEKKSRPFARSRPVDGGWAGAGGGTKRQSQATDDASRPAKRRRSE